MVKVELRAKSVQVQQKAQQRQTSGNPLTPQEMEVFNSKVAQCNKAITASQTFMEKFQSPAERVSQHANVTAIQQAQPLLSRHIL
jgi:hypothetical protein